MKKKLLLGLGLLIGCCLQAQVVITLQLPPLGLTIKPQLWNMSMVNTSGASLNVQLQMIMTDAANNQTVLTGSSPLFLLPSGLRVITVNDVSPVTYTAGVGYTIDPGPNGFLPVGVYNICFTLTKWTNDLSEQIAEECITAEVEPVGPPQLVMPGDSDQVFSPRPFFTWMPPAPFNAFTSLQYDWVLTEVQPMQSAADAIQQNMPVLTQPNISFTSLQYPLSMPALDTGKIYAWRVTAKNNGMAVANSEIWSFRIGKNGIDTQAIPLKGYFARLGRQENSSYILCDGVLRFEYTHDNNSPEVAISIFDISSATRKPVKWNETDDANRSVHFGQNLVELDLTGISGMIDKHTYLLELQNANNEKWFLKFEYHRKED